jgi:hypothetical protein
MAIQVKIDQVIGNMKKLDHTIPLKAAAALYQEGLVVQKESMKRTPVDTGALRASHETSLPSWKGDSLEVTIAVGGPAADYAVPVHERTEVTHTNGQAKFLESAVHEASSSLLERLAQRMKL